VNPTITVILMAKFNPTITAYLVPYIIEGYGNNKFCYWVSLLLKVKHISCTMGTRAYIRQSTHAHGITIANIISGGEKNYILQPPRR